MSISRVSQSMQMNLLKSSIQKNLSELLTSQEQLSSGKRVSQISDDPIAGTGINRLQSTQEIQNQYLSNIKTAATVNSSTDSALSSVYSLITDIQSVVSGAIGDTSTDEERQAAVITVDSTLDELLSLGNTQYMGSYIFGGTNNTTSPFSWDGNSVKFSGNLENMSTQVSASGSETLSALASDAFGTTQGNVDGYKDLYPAATSTTLLSDLNGSLGEGIRLGTMTITGSTIGQYNIDLSGCSSLGDVIEKVNDTLPDTVNLGLSTDGRKLVLNSTNAGETLTVTESGMGMSAHDLGLFAPTPVAGTITGSDLGVTLTRQTALSQLNGGTGINLSNGMIVTNGSNSATLDFSSAKTVQDVLNTINTSGLDITAEINEDGTGINIVNQLAGSKLTIGENGGSTAENLGLRTFYSGTKLSDLNSGSGVNPVTGSDFKITTSDGNSVEIDISGAETVQDVLDKINTQAAAAGVSVTAGLATTGNGIVLTDGSGGTSNFKVERTSTLSNAAEELGILNASGVTAGSPIVGSDVNPVEEQSIFSYLIDLKSALQSNNQQDIQTAADSINGYMDQLSICRGRVAYQGQSLESQQTRMEDAILSTKTMISNLQDIDYVDTITQYESIQATLDASLQTGSQILQKSLLDYIS